MYSSDVEFNRCVDELTWLTDTLPGLVELGIKGDADSPVVRAVETSLGIEGLKDWLEDAADAIIALLRRLKEWFLKLVDHALGRASRNRRKQKTQEADLNKRDETITARATTDSGETQDIDDVRKTIEAMEAEIDLLKEAQALQSDIIVEMTKDLKLAMEDIKRTGHPVVRDKAKALTSERVERMMDRDLLRGKKPYRVQKHANGLVTEFIILYGMGKKFKVALITRDGPYLVKYEEKWVSRDMDPKLPEPVGYATNTVMALKRCNRAIERYLKAAERAGVNEDTRRQMEAHTKVVEELTERFKQLAKDYELDGEVRTQFNAKLNEVSTRITELAQRAATHVDGDQKAIAEVLRTIDELAEVY
jgi:hypothetical protein